MTEAIGHTALGALPPQAPAVRVGAGPGRVDQAPSRDSGDALYGAARQLEGVFVHHLVKALRATVPGGGTPDAPGADVYAGMLDEQLAEVLNGDARTGITEAIYRQMSGAGTVPTTREDEP